jgi:hypothetical protein
LANASEVRIRGFYINYYEIHDVRAPQSPDF